MYDGAISMGIVNRFCLSPALECICLARRKMSRGAPLVSAASFSDIELPRAACQSQYETSAVDYGFVDRACSSSGIYLSSRLLERQ